MNDYYDGLNVKLLKALPEDASRVLELGCANGRLGRYFKQSHPEVVWVGVDVSPDAATIAAEHLDAALTLDVDGERLIEAGSGFDVVVIGDLLEHSRDPERLLARLYDLTAADARIVCCLPNMTHWSVMQRLLLGDLSYDDAGLLDRTHTRFFSRSSAFKAFLDAGWLPHLRDAYRLEAPADAVTGGLAAAARALGVPDATFRQDAGTYQMIVEARKWPLQALLPMEGAAPFSVIVPVNRPLQYELNVRRSPGLLEVGADIVVVEGAHDAAAAYATGAARARHPWRLLVHQDVYVPTGAGFAIAKQLGAIERAGRTGAAVGFAGLHADAGLTGGLRMAGLVVDRASLFSHPNASRAVSIDEFAVALHRDAQARLDPRLGWHLWATDLCLQTLGHADACILRAPLFHNSTTAHALPDAFRASADVLLAKYPYVERIATLCGLLGRRSIPATV